MSVCVCVSKMCVNDHKYLFIFQSILAPYCTRRYAPCCWFICFTRFHTCCSMFIVFIVHRPLDQNYYIQRSVPSSQFPIKKKIKHSLNLSSDCNKRKSKKIHYDTCYFFFFELNTKTLDCRALIISSSCRHPLKWNKKKRTGCCSSRPGDCYCYCC